MENRLDPKMHTAKNQGMQLDAVLPTRTLIPKEL